SPQVCRSLPGLAAGRAMGTHASAPPESLGAAVTDILRPYQSDVIAEIEKAIAAGERRILLVAPTGSGKTIIAAEIVSHFTQRYRPVLVLSHRLEIVTQTCGKLYARGIRHGVIKAGFEPRPMERVQVASVQTLWVRAMRSAAMQLPPADLLIVDECHHATATTWRNIIAAYPDAALIGLTATPCRGDGRGLGGIFTSLIECPQVAELIAQAYPVKSRVYAPVTPNLRGVHVRHTAHTAQRTAVGVHPVQRAAPSRRRYLDARRRKHCGSWCAKITAPAINASSTVCTP